MRRGLTNRPPVTWALATGLLVTIPFAAGARSGLLPVENN